MRKILLSSLVLWAFQAQAHSINNEIEVINPWLRATVGLQKSSGGFLSLKPKQDLTLYQLKSNIAKVEMHAMKMHDNAMSMYEVNSIPLKANQVTKLDGEYHLMLVDLKQKLVPNQKVNIEMLFKDNNQKTIAIKKDFIVKPVSYSE